MKKIVAMLLLVVLSLSCFCSCKAEKKRESIKVGTGANTGTYYVFTSAAGTILKNKTGLDLSVVSTGGSVANINGVDDGDYNMAMVQNDTMIHAYNNLDPINFKREIQTFSVIGEVYPEVVQIVVSGSLREEVKTLADLRDKRVSVGDVGSGVYLNAKELFAAYDMDINEDIIQTNLSVGAAAEEMKDGKLDAFFFTAGAPTTAISELSAVMDIFMLSIEEDVMKEFIKNHKIDGKYEVYSIQNITNKQYSFIPADAPARTIGVTATLIAANTLSEDTVYTVTKALWENKEEIARAHSVGSAMNEKKAFSTIGNVPLHPGAEKYYKEIGIIE